MDLYQPSQMDSSIPVEDIIGELASLKQAGYIRSIGMTEIDAETLRRAHKVHPIHTVELEYSLIDRSIETSIIPTAKELGIRVLTFGVQGHGLLSDALKDAAIHKGVSLSQLMTVWALTRCPDSMSLVGTTSPEHLQENIDALRIELTDADMKEIEDIAASHKVFGSEMRSLTFTDGKPRRG